MTVSVRIGGNGQITHTKSPNAWGQGRILTTPVYFYKSTWMDRNEKERRVVKAKAVRP